MSDEIPPMPPGPGEPDPYAPKHLGKMFRKITEIVRQDRNGKPHVRRSEKLPIEPNKFCDICRKVYYEGTILASKELSPKTCQDCLNELAQGARAVIAPNGEYMFVWGAGVVNLPQKNSVSQDEFDKIKEYVKANPRPDPE